MTSAFSMIDIGLGISSFFLFLGAFFSLIRLVKGPSLANRVVALDYLTMLSVSGMILMAIYFDHVDYLDIALVLALLSFIAVVAFARFIDFKVTTGNTEGDIDD